jgi:hypothetical protein
MKKIAVIGAGMSGLASAHALAVSGKASVTLFERDDMLGGRLYDIFAGRVMSPELYPNAIAFTETLGLMDQLERLTLDDFGVILPSREIITAREMRTHGIKKILLECKSPTLFFEYVRTILSIFRTQYNIENFTSTNDPALRLIDFKTWLNKNHSPFIQQYVLNVPQFMNMNFLDQITADEGLFLANFLYKMKAPVYYFKRAPKAYAEAFQGIYKNLGITLRRNTTVVKVQRVRGGFQIILEDKSVVRADVVVCALPLPETKRITGISVDIPYTWDRGLLVKGAFKYPHITLGTSAAPETNIRVFYNWGDFQVYYLINPGEKEGDGYYMKGKKQEPPNFDDYYENGKWELANEFYTPYAVPMKLNTLSPSLKQGEDLYICGDFYSYPCLESAVSSGKMVADLIIKKME